MTELEARNAALNELVATAPKLTPDDLDRLRRLLNPSRTHTLTRTDLELAA